MEAEQLELPPCTDQENLLIITILFKVRDTGEGSTFYVQLPLKTDGEVAEEREACAEPESSEKVGLPGTTRLAALP
ncbi:MAG: hypothetical protein U5L00_06610 [Desulfovermiculus sp.]|nr:hypothetical protein [Desulfovermiculus sp.]